MVKVVKKIDGEKVSYVLRCLWHILNDKKSDHMMRWHPEMDNAFIVADEDKLIEYFKTYTDFKTSFLSFRRSLYLYGFKKARNIWTNPYINKNDPESLKRVIREKKVNKNKNLSAKFAKHFPQFLMLQHQHQMMMQRMAAQQQYPGNFFSAASQISPIPSNGFFPSESAPGPNPNPKIEKDVHGRNVILPGSFNTLPMPQMVMPGHHQMAMPQMASPMLNLSPLDGLHLPPNLPTPTNEHAPERRMIKEE